MSALYVNTGFSQFAVHHHGQYASHHHRVAQCDPNAPLTALRNGAPFKDWDLPPALARIRAKLKSYPDGDRQFVKVLGAVLDHGLAAVEVACTETPKAGIASGDDAPRGARLVAARARLGCSQGWSDVACAPAT